MRNCVTHFACDCITEKVIKLEKENYRLRCEKQADLNKIELLEFTEKQAYDRLAEEKAKSQKLVEALEHYANHESVIKEAYHTGVGNQIQVVHTFINHVATEALKEYKGEK